MAAPISKNPSPIGQAWLHLELGLVVLPPATTSFVHSGARRTEVSGHQTVDYYPRPYAVEPSVVAHLRFAFRHEPINLGVLVATLKTIPPTEIEAWVRAEPTGVFSRRVWFFYETFTGRTLDLEDARTGNYVEALDSDLHIVAKPRKSRRHRVTDNLLGGRALCPTVRRTARLTSSLHVDEEARALIGSYDPIILTRAVNYLYAKETRSSFAIEGETPNASRAERFVAALKAAPAFTPDKASLIALQGSIVDPRYAATDWRNIQNFVGETVGGYREEVHYLCPRPQDVSSLMDGWSHLIERAGGDPVTAAAVAAFAFVFIHPFEDGNGRIHRFLMHHILAKRRFGPDGMIFPVSAAILRDRRSYDEVLASFSKPLLSLIDWDWTKDQAITVSGDSSDHYRYFDATVFAEYLHDRVVDTVRRDLKEELGFIAIFDRALGGVREIVDMPDRRAGLFVRLCLQNNGKLSAAKRSLFAEVTDAEVEQMEAAVLEAQEREAAEHP